MRHILDQLISCSRVGLAVRARRAAGVPITAAHAHLSPRAHSDVTPTRASPNEPHYLSPNFTPITSDLLTCWCVKIIEKF